MLRICNLAGKTLATFSADEVGDKSVKELKSSLAKQIGATRFQQRLFTEDHTELQDDSVVPCCDVQLVVQSFVQAEECEMEQLISACRENRPDELVDLLRKPLNPCGAHEQGGFAEALVFAAENGHLQIVETLLEAGICAADDVVGAPALRAAAENGHSHIVKLLFEAGAFAEDVA